jgi:hypothetical protein
VITAMAAKNAKELGTTTRPVRAEVPQPVDSGRLLEAAWEVEEVLAEQECCEAAE